MRTQLYTAQLFLLCLFSVTTFAQQLISGSYPGTREDLLSIRYRNVRNVNSNTIQGNFAGIPDLSSNRSRNGRNTRSDLNMNYGAGGSFTFTITYDAAADQFTNTTVAGGITFTNTVDGAGALAAADGKAQPLRSINLMRLFIRTQNSSSTISISNLTVDGMPVSGSYQRSNNNGESEWYLFSPALSNGFVVTGRVTLSGSFANSAEGQRIRLEFSQSSSNPGVLPVSWGGIQAQRSSSNGARISWSTLQESNTSHFDIQRSIDGVRFENIGRLAAAGNSQVVRNYHFEDRNASADAAYYRLAQVDADGKTSYSTVVRIQRNSQKATLAVSGGLVRLQLSGTGNRQLRLMNQHGQVLQQQSTSASQADMQLGGLPNGIYLIHITDANQETQVLRVIK